MSEFYASEDHHDYLIDHPIFRDAYALYYQLEDKRFATWAEAMQSTSVALSEIHTQANDAGLMYRKARLTGPKLTVPFSDYDPESGTFSLYTGTMSASDDNPEANPPVTGQFLGFNTIARREDDGSYSASIHHHVRIGDPVGLGTFMGDLFAQGNLVSSQLEFIDDLRQRDAAQALTTLADATHDADTALTTAAVHDLLTPNDEGELFDYRRLRKIGKTIRELETKKLQADEDIDLAYRDGMIDFVGAKLGIKYGAIFSVDAISVYLKGADPATGPHITDNPEQIRDIYQFSDMEFSPYYWKYGQRYFTREKVGTLALAAYTSHPNTEEIVPMYIPLEKIRELTPEN